MIVIAIFWILTSMAVGFWTNRHQVKVARSERLSNMLFDTIKGARDSMIIGRGYYTWGTYYPVQKRTIYIDPSSITTYYTRFGSTQSGIENRIAVPFFDGDPLYRIGNLSVYSLRQTASTLQNLPGGQYTMTGMSNLIINIDQQGIISFTGSDFTAPVNTITARTIQIDAIYEDLYHVLTFDRASWIITVSKPINI